MGCSCSTNFVKGAGVNACSDAIGDIKTIENFGGMNTYPPSDDGLTAASELCTETGGTSDNPEWEYYTVDQTVSAQYNPDDFKEICPGGTSAGCTGNGAKCIRIAFTGDPVQCCLNDYKCVSKITTNTRTCYSDDDKKQTCQPQYRSLGESSCRPLMLDYCLGTDLNDSDNPYEWFERWTSNECPKFVDKLVYGCEKKTGIVSSDGLQFARLVMTAAFEKYASQGFSIMDSISDPNYTQFESLLYSVCDDAPMACNEYLQSLCNGETVDSVMTNPAHLKWCGCYLPTAEYDRYNIYQLNKECTPPCNQKIAIPLVTPDGSNIIKCEQNVCIIDDTTINLVNTESGDIDIDQVCGSCNEGQCDCLMTTNTVDIIDSLIGGKIQFSEQCGNINVVDSPSSDNTTNYKFLIVLFLLVIAIIIIIIIISIQK